MQNRLIAAFIGLGVWGCRGGTQGARRTVPVAAPTSIAPPTSMCNKKNIRCLVGFAKYDEFAAELEQESGIKPETADVDNSILVLLGDGPQQFINLGFSLPEIGPARDDLFERADLPLKEAQQAFESPQSVASNAEQPPAQWRYYGVSVRHHRMKTNDTPERTMNAYFTEDLNVVRVRLPETDSLAQQIGHYSTNVGEVILSPSLARPVDGTPPISHGETMGTDGHACYKMDHWYGSVEQVKRDFTPELRRDRITDVKRVELVTTGRINGSRFAAIGFYLGYEKEDTLSPTFYLVEAGQALNYVRQVYYSKGVASDDTTPDGDGVAKGISTYNPSRLSDPANMYKAWLVGTTKTVPMPSWEPEALTIRAAHPNVDGVTSTNAYIEVVATLTRSEDLERFRETPTSGW